jgi:hypothetical protein
VFLLTEFVLCAVAVAAALFTPNLGGKWFLRAERLLNRLAQHRGCAVLSVGLVALTLRAALLPVAPIPRPGMHDDFSYLLMADTFAHGRVANSTHPMWIHFETFHIIQKPTYVSKYYPAQGLFLAAGQLIFGHPFWGVWLSVGAMCAGICWMLQGWLPPEWALLGGLLAVIRLGTFSYWANSYMGGAVAAIGGALALGALPRIKQQQRVRDASLMGLGLAILATSRPYEGLFFSLPIGAALLVWMFSRSGPTLRASMGRIILPLGLVVILASGAMLFYFWRTTGSPLRTPYAVDLETYDPAPLFPWQTLRASPSYNHAVIEEFYLDSMLEHYQYARRDPVVLALAKTMFLWAFFFGPVLTLPILMLAVVLPYGMFYKDVSHEARFLLIVCGICFLALLLPIYFFPHYAAPVTAAIYAAVLLAMRQVSRWELRGKPTGRFIVRAIPAICFILVLLVVTARSVHISLPPPRWPSWCTRGLQLLDRARVEAHLEEYGGNHLAIVRYQQRHEPGTEWVYNRADIDNSRVVWARDMGKEKNRELLEYFKDRQVWLVEPDENPPRVSPYGDVFGGAGSETPGVPGQRKSPE